MEGLAQAHLERTNDEYSFGIFESGIPEQLPWMMRSRAKASEDLTDVPHWSWASKGGSKYFWAKPTYELRLIHHTRAVFESSGVIKVDGFVAQSRTSIIKSRKSARTHKRIFQDLLSLVGWFRKDSLHWIQIVSRHTRTIGIAAFDRDHYTKVYILFLKQWRDYKE